jgi:conjugal transfer pilus assembly protein TraW
MKTILLLLILPILVFSSTLIRKYETGETFDFAENDMIEDIQNQIKNNKPQIEAKIEEYKKTAKDKANNYKPADLKKLTPAIKNNTFYPDITYTNPKDIYDNKGDIIYPKGFKFNPLDYQNIPYQMIVINGDSNEETEWLIKNNFIDNIKYMILLSDGNYKEVAEKINQPVFYAMPKITEKFNIEHTPSIITQIGNKMEVKEICISCKKEDEK